MSICKRYHNAQRLIRNALTAEKIEDYCVEALNLYTEFLGYDPKPTVPLLEDAFENLLYFNWIKTAFYRFVQNFKFFLDLNEGSQTVSGQE
jgi:hypothetical protein